MKYNLLMVGSDFKADNEALTDDGSFVVCTSDEATGPRYVKWVRNIEVRKAD